MCIHFSIRRLWISCLAPAGRSCHNLCRVLTRHIKTGAKVALFASALGFAGPEPAPPKSFNAYHDGDNIVFSPETTGSRRLASFGPWNLGERLSEGKPMDNRLNLYVVIPGGQYRSSAHPEYDHNRIVNKYTVDGKARDWDIFYCFVLDPSLTDDIRSESDLLMAAHQTFQPADLYDVGDAPGSATLAEKVGISSLADLRKFRRKNGTLPRLIIVPARLAVRATAEQPDVTITHPAQ